MGNLIDLYSKKRHGLSVEDAGRETFVSWNGPLVHPVDKLGEKKVASDTLRFLIYRKDQVQRSKTSFL